MPDWTRELGWRRLWFYEHEVRKHELPGELSVTRYHLYNASYSPSRMSASVRLPAEDSPDVYRFVDVDGIIVDKIDATFAGPPNIPRDSRNVVERGMVFEWLRGFIILAELVVRAKRSTTESLLNHNTIRKDIF